MCHAVSNPQPGIQNMVWFHMNFLQALKLVPPHNPIGHMIWGEVGTQKGFHAMGAFCLLFAYLCLIWAFCNDCQMHTVIVCFSSTCMTKTVSCFSTSAHPVVPTVKRTFQHIISKNRECKAWQLPLGIVWKFKELSVFPMLVFQVFFLHEWKQLSGSLGWSWSRWWSS